ncbi:MAG: IscS subfamily cysteine desulfurase [Gammaproteobacteria bacterium]|nr:IscS subfamily cysteine desulfurase [Gammaproteobacteria bacterium]
MRPVYLDYAATTPVDPRVAERMAGCLTLGGIFANPASRSHVYGWQAEEAVEAARRQVAALIGAEPREIVWTSGATEADNLAIKGAAEFYSDRGRHIVTSAIEHKAVLDTCHYLEGKGYRVTYLQPGADGLITPAMVESALEPDTFLVSLMHVNNEIGTATDVAAIGAITRARNILFHVDAAQSAGKLPIDLSAWPVDLMSLSAHKVYGPKGIGALFVRRNPQVRIEPQIHGGGHERGMRSGTLPTHQIVGMGEAFEIARQEMVGESERIAALREQLRNGLQDIEGVRLNGHLQQRVAGILNLSFAGVDGETLLMALKDLAVSSGSACNSATVAPSYVIKALGVADDLALASIRFSLGRFTGEDDVALALDAVRQTVQRLRDGA